MYPAVPLPDLFAGSQITLVGRYRGDADDTSITLRGEVNGEPQSFTYSSLDFPERAGGEPFIARLWATRRIGDLLQSIRLNGENPEIVESIVDLSVRYGIITPYTSFLIDENDILSQQGRDRAAADFEEQAQTLSSEASGARAVTAADDFAGFAAAEAPAPASVPMLAATQNAPLGGMGGGNSNGLDNGVLAPQEPTDGEGMLYDADESGEGYVNPVRSVNDKTFLLQGEVWTDTEFSSDTMETQKVVFLSDEYFALLDLTPNMSDYLALGDHVIVVVDGVAYEVTPE